MLRFGDRRSIGRAGEGRQPRLTQPITLALASAFSRGSRGFGWVPIFCIPMLRFDRPKHYYVFYVGRLEAWLPWLIAITPCPERSFAPVGRQALTFSVPDAITATRPDAITAAQLIDGAAALHAIAGDARSSLSGIEQVPVTCFPAAPPSASGLAGRCSPAGAVVMRHDDRLVV